MSRFPAGQRGADLYRRQCDMGQYMGLERRLVDEINDRSYNEVGPSHPQYQNATPGFPEPATDARVGGDHVGDGCGHQDCNFQVKHVHASDVTEPLTDWERDLLKSSNSPGGFRHDGSGADGRTRIYISGPMRGYPDLNHPAFDSLQYVLEQYGYHVHSPAQNNRKFNHTPDTPYSECIKIDVTNLLDSDAIVFLPGWRQSEGARFEAEIARSFGLDFYEATPVSGIDGDPRTYWQWEARSATDLAVEGIDQEARRLVFGERAATYGHPRGDFDTIAKLWTGILLKKLKAANAAEITAEEVALMMAALKLARLASSPKHHDSQVDTIGYMLCLARLQEDPHEIAAWDETAERLRKANGLQ